MKNETLTLKILPKKKSYKKITIPYFTLYLFFTLSLFYAFSLLSIFLRFGYSSLEIEVNIYYSKEKHKDDIIRSAEQILKQNETKKKNHENYLKLQKHREYQKYLELKEKFEGGSDETDK